MTDTQKTDEKPTTLKHMKKYRTAGAFFFLLIFVAVLIAGYSKIPKIVSVSSLENVSARGGKIEITYDRPVTCCQYEPSGGLGITSELSEDGFKEIYTLTAPTRFNSLYHLIRIRGEKQNKFLWNNYASHKLLNVYTGKQEVFVQGLIPPENSNPSPETFDNQLVIKFSAPIMGKNFKKGTNILPGKMPFVKLSPELIGYYRWTDDSILTFNFTEDKPQFETTYEFEVFPEKFVDPDKQVWIGDKTKFQVTTSTNEVYVMDFSLKGDVNWQSVLRIEFSGNMVGALDVLKKKSQEMIPINITPEAGGEWIWTNARTLEFHPDNKLGYPVRNTVTVSIQPEINKDPDRKWRAGNKPEMYSFYVLPRKQSLSAYNLHGDSVPLESDLVVSFSREMVTQKDIYASIPNNVDAENIPLLFTPKIKGKFNWINTSEVKFHPDNLWSELTEYKVQLNPGFNPDPRYEWTGTKDFAFKTVENLVRAELFFTPENRMSSSTFFSNKGRYRNTENIPPEKRMWILFDKDIGRFIKKGLDLHSAVVMTPRAEGTYTWLSNRLLEFVPKQNWQENKTYTVRLTDKLLYHPEQHFPENKNQFTFSTGQNLVRSPQLTQSSVKSASPLIQEPDSPLVINFSKNMRTIIKVGRTYGGHEVIAESLPVVMEPELDMTVFWKDPRQLKIAPVKYWKPETVYKITLNNALLPQEEAAFEFGNTIYVKTRKNYVSIDRFSPQGQVGRRITVDVAFSKMIKPDDIQLEAPDHTGMFTIDPPLEGEWVWLADNKMQFKPATPLAPSTRYSVIFDPNKIPGTQFKWHITPEQGKIYYDVLEYNFYTPPLQVVEINERFDFDEKDILKQRFFMDMKLSEPVSETELRKYFSIWYEKKRTDENGQTVMVEVPLLYTLQTREEPAGKGVQNFSVVSDWMDRPAEDRKIAYKIAAGLPPIQGNLILEKDFAGYFFQEKPKSIKINSIKWKWQDRKYTAFITFNAPIEPDILKRNLSVSAEEEGEQIPLAYDVSVSSSGAQEEFKYEVISDFVPDTTYMFTIKEGMAATDGAFTTEQVVQITRTPNLSRQLAFALNGSILSKKDLAHVPVLSTNVNSFYIIIDKIFASNVNYFINNRIDSANISDLAKNVHKQQYSVQEIAGGESIKNRVVTTHIDLSKLFKDNVYGLYRVSVSQRPHLKSRSSENSRWFLSTDIGMVARQFDNNFVVWTNSLHSLEALAGIKVDAVDRWNQVVGTAYTDNSGFARLTVTQGSAPTHIVAGKAGDFCFLDMRKHKDKLAGFDIEGISSKKSAVKSYIYSERGVYRPGDIVHIVAVTRGKEGRLPEQYPVTFRLTNPTGKHIVTERYTLDHQGLYVYDFQVPEEAKTGKWQAAVLWQGNAAGNYGFQVEEFIPNKIKVELAQRHEQVYAGDTLTFKVKATYLFGPPAEGRPVSGSVKLRPHYFKPKGYHAFQFGHDDNKFQRLDDTLAEVRLDDQGTHVFEYKIPTDIDSPIGLSANYSATVIDKGGRGVSSYADTNILLYSQFTGVRRLSDKPVYIHQPIGFQIVNIDGDGNMIDRSQQKLSIKIFKNKQITHYRKNERGYYRYVTEKEKILIKEIADTRDAENRIAYTPEFSGEHILEVEDLIGKQVTRYKFDVKDKEVGSIFVEKADRVEMKVLTRDIVVNGEVDVEVYTPFQGKVLIIGERDKVLFTHLMNMTGSRKIITIPVKPAYMPNFYISAIAVKPVYQGSRTDPIYATGLVNINVMDKAHAPGIKLIAPRQANPNGDMHVQIHVNNTNNDEMYYTIAAVDVGILDLTQYKLPDMTGYFNQKQRLEVTHYSMYPMVMPFDPDIKYTISPSGDAPSRALIKKKRVNPDSQQRVKSVALWSGLLKLDAGGRGDVTFKLPDFDGTVRVMAVAFGNQRFASRQQDVVVRGKLVIKPTLPRFLATGDDFVIPVSVFNRTETADNIKVSIKTSSHVRLLGPMVRTVFVQPGRASSVDFAVKVNDRTGVSDFDIQAQGAGERIHKLVKVPVRSPGTYVTERGGGSVDQHTPISIRMPDKYLEGTQEYAMMITSNKLDRFQNSLLYLLRYPHGCLEQTTSRLFPLLYYSDMIKATGKIFTPEKGPHYYLREGIAKIERMQLENGAFSYWEGGSQVNDWAFVYASHFMVEAQKKGLKIDNNVWNNMLYQLNQKVSISLDRNRLYNRSSGVNHYLYMLYVLALANENVLSRLNYVYDTYFQDLKLHDRARLAAAFSASGDNETAIRIIQGIDGLSEYDTGYRDTGGHFASNVRDLAIILDALTQIEPQSKKIPLLVEVLASKNRNGRWGSTQENAFAFLAIGKALAGSKAMRTNAKIILGDGTEVPFDTDLTLKTPELLKGEVRIEVIGDGEVSYTWEAAGIIESPRSLQQDVGIQVRRRFLDSKGKQIDLKNVRQGDLVVAEIKIKSLLSSSQLENIAVTDLLATGFEIENTRLNTSESLPWIKQGLTPDYLDIRDDRLNVFVSITPEEKVYYYTVRAVTVGNFKVPSIYAEAMYNPDYISKADSGSAKILPGK